MEEDKLIIVCDQAGKLMVGICSPFDIKEYQDQTNGGVVITLKNPLQIFEVEEKGNIAIMLRPIFITFGIEEINILPAYIIPEVSQGAQRQQLLSNYEKIIQNLRAARAGLVVANGPLANDPRGNHLKSLS